MGDPSMDLPPSLLPWSLNGNQKQLYRYSYFFCSVQTEGHLTHHTEANSTGARRKECTQSHTFSQMHFYYFHTLEFSFLSKALSLHIRTIYNITHNWAESLSHTQHPLPQHFLSLYKKCQHN